MKNPVPPRKKRKDTVLDAQLTPEQADSLYARIDQGMPLAKAAAFLQSEFGIRLSESSICRWQTSCREARAEQGFVRSADRVFYGKQRAGLLGINPEKAEELHQANVVLLSQALFEACLSEDRHSMAQISRMFAQVMGVVARNRRADLRLAQAEERDRRLADRELSAANDRHFQLNFDPERAAMTHLDALRAIEARKDLTSHEKITAAAEVVFPKPEADPPSSQAPVEPEPAPAG